MNGNDEPDWTCLPVWLRRRHVSFFLFTTIVVVVLTMWGY